MIKISTIKILLVIFIITTINYFNNYYTVNVFDGDFYKYQRDFYTHLNSDSLTSILLGKVEFGYYLVAYLIGKIWGSFHFFLFVASFFIYFSAARAFIEISNSKNIGLLVILFFFPIFFAYDALINNVLRQGFAIAILLLANFPYKERSLFGDISIIILASLFHSSVVIILPIVVFLHCSFKHAMYLILFIVSFVLYILDIPMYFKDIIVDIIILTGVVDLSYILRSINYNVGFNIFKAIALVFPVIFYFFMFRGKITLDQGVIRLWNYYFIISGVAMLLSSMPYHDRVMMYAWAFLPLLLAPFLDQIIRFLLVHPRKHQAATNSPVDE
jgi:hypothetical protein